MNFPLRRTIYFVGICIFIILLGVLTLGFRQYQHLKNFGKVTEQSEKLIFQFAIIREHINELLVEGEYSAFSNVTEEIEDLHADLSFILSNKNIPDEYKLTFINQVDLPGIVLLLRKLDGSSLDMAKLRELNREVRILGDRLMLFDRVIVNHAKRQLISFQSVVIGALAIVIFIIVNILFLFHRRIAGPLLILDQQVKEVGEGKRENLSFQLSKKSYEINQLANSFNNLLIMRKETSEGLIKKHKTIQAVQRIIYSIAHAQNRQELFKEVCRSLFVNDLYCVVTISVPDENQNLVPAVQESPFFTNKSGSEESLKVLRKALEGKGSENNPEVKAYQTGNPIIKRDILEGIPKGLFSNTPFEGLSLSCVVLPISVRGNIYGVLTVYGSSQNTFDEEEVDLLSMVSGELALALNTLEIKEDLTLQEGANRQIVDAVDAVLVAISSDGSIISMNNEAEKVFACSSDDMLTKSWLDFFQPDDEKIVPINENGTYNLPGLITNKCYEMNIISKGGEKRILKCRFVKCLNKYAEEDDVLCIAQDNTDHKKVMLDMTSRLNTEKTRKLETIRSSRLESLGELATGVAHEINNLSNGIINYAQLLSDETGETVLDNGQLNILDNVIKEGERIAEIAQKLLFYSREQGDGKALVKLSDIITDSLMLIKHHLKNDGIKVNTFYPDDLPAISIHIQQLQQIFLNILHNARRALNNRYPMKNENKRLEIKGDMITKQDRNWIRISITDWGEGINSQDLAQVFNPGFTTKPPGEGTGMGLTISRNILMDHGGHIEIGSQFGDHTTVTVELPVS